MILYEFLPNKFFFLTKHEVSKYEFL